VKVCANKPGASQTCADHVRVGKIGTVEIVFFKLGFIKKRPDFRRFPPPLVPACRAILENPDMAVPDGVTLCEVW
jgi:hypothetical protein